MLGDCWAIKGHPVRARRGDANWLSTQLPNIASADFAPRWEKLHIQYCSSINIHKSIKVQSRILWDYVSIKITVPSYSQQQQKMEISLSSFYLKHLLVVCCLVIRVFLYSVPHAPLNTSAISKSCVPSKISGFGTLIFQLDTLTLDSFHSIFIWGCFGMNFKPECISIPRLS